MRLHSTGAVLAAMVMALTGCGTPDTDPAPSPEPSPSESASAEPTAEQAAIDAYESKWDVIAQASREEDADPPELELYAMGQALDLMRGALESAVEDGVTVEGGPALSPEVVGSSPSPDPDTVELSDCVDSTGWTESGGPEGSGLPGGQHRTDATVVFDGLAWRVAQIHTQEAGTC